MKKFHHYMRIVALLASALAFKSASAALGWAMYHQRRFNLLEDERITAIMGLKPAPVVHRSIVSKNQWSEECPLCGAEEECGECHPMTKADILRTEAARRGIRVIDYPEK
jgi:hypothetical protein